MAVIVSRLVSHPLPTSNALVMHDRPAHDGDALVTRDRETAAHRFLTMLEDGGLLIALAWSLPFAILALGIPLAVVIVGAVWAGRLLQSAF